MGYFACPNCGGEVKAKAKACPHCGSDEKTGWSEDPYLDGVELYDEDDYADTIEREFGKQYRGKDKKKFIMSIIAIVALICFILSYIF